MMILCRNRELELQLSPEEIAAAEARASEEGGQYLQSKFKHLQRAVAAKKSGMTTAAAVGAQRIITKLFTPPAAGTATPGKAHAKAVKEYARPAAAVPAKAGPVAKAASALTGIAKAKAYLAAKHKPRRQFGDK